MQSIDSQITELVLAMEFSTMESMEDFKRYARELGDGPFNPPSYYDLLNQEIYLNVEMSKVLNATLVIKGRNELKLNKLKLDTRGLILCALRADQDVTKKKQLIRQALDNFPKQLTLMGEETDDAEKSRKQRMDIQIYMKKCEEILASV